MLIGTPFYVPKLDHHANLLTLLKSGIVLSSWVFAYISLKHLPLSVVSPMQATRPMWTLVGALLIFGERLNAWQWTGVILAIGSILIFSITSGHKQAHKTKNSGNKKYYICLALAILIGACSGLYDKYLMRQYDHNAVQVYYTLYQGVGMLAYWTKERWIQYRDYHQHRVATPPAPVGKINILPIALISIFLIISDNVYMLALRDPDSLIAVVSTIRRGGTVIGFAYGILFLHEPEPKKKITTMAGILIGLICLALGSLY